LQNYLESKCFGCGGKCCENIDILADIQDLERLISFGNKAIYTDYLHTTESQGLYIQKAPEIQGRLPQLNVYKAFLSGVCVALVDGQCSKHKYRPDICRTFIAGRDCKKI
jgi:Fe-S-cluster containining protein